MGLTLMGLMRYLKQGRPVLLKYFFAWFGMMVIAIINGGAREKLYKPHVGDLAAEQISTITLLILIAAYFGWLLLHWRIKTARQAWLTGIMWLAMTLVFEFGIGFLSGHSWGTMLREYDVFSGRIWLLIPIWVLVGPYVLFRFNVGKFQNKQP